MNSRRTQAERREATQSALLIAARTHFGEHGYSDTNLDDIAEACDVTVRPIYHYFKSKLGLFQAVVDQIEGDIIANIKTQDDATIIDVWSGFVKNCEDPHFRQIILIDSPNLLGRSRTSDGPVSKALRKRAADIFGRSPDGLTMTLLLGALSSAAIYIAENGASTEDYDKVRKLIEFHVNKP